MSVVDLADSSRRADLTESSESNANEVVDLAESSQKADLAESPSGQIISTVVDLAESSLEG